MMKLISKKVIISISVIALLASPISSSQINLFEKEIYVNAETTSTKNAKEKVSSVKVSKKLYQETYQSDEGVIYKKVKYTRPVISGKSQGIKKINQFYKNLETKWKKNAKENLDEAKSLVGEISNGGFYTDEVDFDVKYNKKGYISILSNGYEYTMGAHGMPYLESHTFDLNTGKELKLTDIMSGNNAKIKKKIVQAFTKLINKEPDAYFPEAIQTVNSTASAKSKNFYLDKKGIVFYYGPYDLAPYAGGVVEARILFTAIDTFKLKLS